MLTRHERGRLPRAGGAGEFASRRERMSSRRDDVSLAHLLPRVAADCNRSGRRICHVLNSHCLMHRDGPERELLLDRHPRGIGDVSVARWGKTDASVSTILLLLSCDWLREKELGPLPRVSHLVVSNAVCCFADRKVAECCIVAGRKTIISPMSRPSTALLRLSSLEGPS